MSTKDIKLVNASEKNLKGISFVLPKGNIISISGASGSGKSTLVHDVIAKEISRRSKITLEQASKFERLVRSDFKSAELPDKAMTLPQKNIKQAKSSSVATVTGLNDLIRSSFLKYGIIKCKCGENVDDTISLDTMMKLVGNKVEQIRYCFKIKTPKDIDNLKSYVNKLNHKFVYIEGANKKIKSINIESAIKKNELAYIVIDSLEVFVSAYHDMSRVKLFSNGKCMYNFSVQTFCSHCLSEYQVKSLSLFTKSAISELSGCCKDCNGNGSISNVDYKKLVDGKSPLNEKFLKIPHSGKAYKYIYLQDSHIKRILKKHKVNGDSKNFGSLNASSSDELSELISSKVMAHKDHPIINEFIKDVPCKSCNGTGFNKAAEAVKLKGKGISFVLNLNAYESSMYLDSDDGRKISEAIESLSIGHLSLNRSTDTLSGGELQRLKLVKVISQKLIESTIIIDEPSLGLNLYDTKNLYSIFEKLRENNNTVILVDHSEHIIKNSDYNLTLGPGSGGDGGYITDLPDDFKITRSQKNINELLKFSNLSKNNLKNIKASIPLHSLTSIAGPSGSGKSSLGLEIFNHASFKQGKLKSIDSCIYISQKEVTTNRRSTVASYLDLSDSIRNLYHQASYQRFPKSYFSPNSKLAACHYCLGIGLIDDEVCHSCNGGKLSPGPLSVSIDEKNIAEFLSLPVSELIDLDVAASIRTACSLLIRLGLGHLNLGRPTPDISGGELQRIKLAQFLLENTDALEDSTKHTLIILDEPSRGLSKLNIISIIDVIDEIIDGGNTVVAIEHNLNIIRKSCHVIELGPGAGFDGGSITYSGPGKNYKIKTRNTVNKSQKIIKNNNRIRCKSWLDDSNFNMQKEYSSKCERIPPSGVNYFNTKHDLKSAVRYSEEYFFNPFINYFHRYKRIPASIIKETLSSVFDAGFTDTYIDSKKVSNKGLMKSLDNSNIWMFSIATNDFEKAYQLGGGCVITTEKGKRIFGGTRIIDPVFKVVGSMSITPNLFNKYYSGCSLCLGEGVVCNYKNLGLNEGCKVTDISFYPKNIQPYIKKYLTIIKRAVKKFKEEKIVNLDIEFKSIEGSDLEIALHGLPGLSFIKDNGRANALSDKITWPGVLYFMSSYEKKYGDDLAIKSKAGKHLNCPECGGHGYHRELDYYYIDGNPVVKNLL